MTHLISYGRLRITTIVLSVMALTVSQTVISQEISGETCGDPFNNGVGPFDYTDPKDRGTSDRIPIVEAYHFNAKVESLQGGMSSAHVMDDLDYTLRAVPNHHRALYAVAKHQLQVGVENMRPRTAECYFERAITFRPRDSNVHLVFGIFLQQSGKESASEAQYLRAIEIDESSAEAYYNLGLLYLEMGKNDKALTSARMAYDLGYPLQGLKNMLIRSGDWEDRPE